ncbi:MULTISPECIES: hypothetical protein [Bacillaceae]|uniref:hypothetical protein n=1 Tax=Bacillaceae TaxID=186817 RepID=UPI000C7800C4|nr:MULTISPECIES: hypothetical protein [Bacillaceae]PLR68107.1 hypothetical protein CYJ36_08305 [Bacillus sp. UMB0893]QNG61245.1 hypothetical protein H4O14_07145 [Bacillus sp. PAMC26568]
MYKKLCNRCYQPSFSSCSTGKWTCPICSNDLTKMKPIRAIHQPKANLDRYVKKESISKNSFDKLA